MSYVLYVGVFYICFFFQAEYGIRYLVRSRGLGDVYKRQRLAIPPSIVPFYTLSSVILLIQIIKDLKENKKVRLWIYVLAGISLALGFMTYPTQKIFIPCLLYTSDAADERSSVDLGGRRIIKKQKQQTKKKNYQTTQPITKTHHILQYRIHEQTT